MGEARGVLVPSRDKLSCRVICVSVSSDGYDEVPLHYGCVAVRIDKYDVEIHLSL